MRCDRTPSNPNNYIWSTYFRPQTPEDKLLRNLMGGAVALLGVLFFWMLTRKRQPSQPASRVEHGDLFKNW